MSLFNNGCVGADLVGYLASVLVLATFTMRSMLALRVLGLMSNLAFVIYAVMSKLDPILLLHLLLFPINLCRLWELLATESEDGAVRAGICDSDAVDTASAAHTTALRKLPPDSGY